MSAVFAQPSPSLKHDTSHGEPLPLPTGPMSIEEFLSLPGDSLEGLFFSGKCVPRFTLPMMPHDGEYEDPCPVPTGFTSNSAETEKLQDTGKTTGTEGKDVPQDRGKRTEA